MNMSWFQFKFSLFDFCHSEFESLFFPPSINIITCTHFGLWLISLRLVRSFACVCVCFVLFDLYISMAVSCSSSVRACVRLTKCTITIAHPTHPHARTHTLFRFCCKKRSSLYINVHTKFDIPSNIYQSVIFHCLSVCSSPAPFSFSIPHCINECAYRVLKIHKKALCATSICKWMQTNFTTFEWWIILSKINIENETRDTHTHTHNPRIAYWCFRCCFKNNKIRIIECNVDCGNGNYTVSARNI